MKTLKVASAALVYMPLRPYSKIAACSLTAGLHYLKPDEMGFRLISGPAITRNLMTLREPSRRAR